LTNLDMVIIGAYRREDYMVLEEVAKRYGDGGFPMSQTAHFLYENDTLPLPLYACVTKSIKPPEGKREFFVVIIYNTNSFKSAISSIAMPDSSLLAIVDSRDNIIAANREDISSSKLDAKPNTIVGGKEVSPVNKLSINRETLLQQKIIQGLDWRIVGIIPGAELGNDLSSLKQFGFSMGSIVILLFLCIGLIINKSITSPISRMANFMNSLGENYSTHRLVMRNTNEIGVLAEVMNKMLDNIDNMTKKVISTQEKLYLMDLSKKQAELLALQIQLNPHFLYNTLDCVRSIAISRNVREIEEIVHAMAKILRYSIKDNSFVMVIDEINSIKDYLKIIQIRHNNRFSISYELDEKMMEMVIPKMILQPIIENAVFHGLEQKAGAGTLLIRGYIDSGNRIVFSIQDDGKGMSPEVLEKLKRNLSAHDYTDDMLLSEKKSIGLINIDRRIKLLYGDDFGLDIDSMSYNGTKVTIELPINITNQNQ